ncbi:MAG: hypothetical protein ACREEO_00940, partial [Phenylobacterium sp.]
MDKGFKRGLAAAALLVLAAWRGGMGALLAEQDGVAAWRRAASATLNLLAEGAVIAAAAFWAREHE